MLKLRKEEMMNYLIESSLLLLGFALVFHFLLAKDNAYQFNRLYLIGSLAVSLSIPLIEWRSPLVIETEGYWVLPDLGGETMDDGSVSSRSLLSLGILLGVWSYWAIVAYKAYLFTGQIFKLLKNIRRGEWVDQSTYKLILLAGKVPIHSFGSFVFAAKTDYEEGRIEEALIQHELAHIRQKHSWDILGLELVAIFFWFHPVLKYFREAIKLNHEHLSDQAVIRNGVDVIYYQQLLLKNICTYQTNPLASPLHFSFTKKRFQMMPKHLKATEGRHKRWLVLPITLLFFALSNISLTGQTEVKEIPPPPPPIKKEDVDRPPPPPPVKVFVEKNPTAQQLEAWQDAKEYGVWFDGKHIDNAALKSMSPQDIGWFHVSRLLKNARNYGKYTHQVNVYSQVYFEKHLKNRKQLPLIREVKAPNRVERKSS